jgi:hypothetical protein
MSDTFDPNIKYGGGHLGTRNLLASISYLVDSYERVESRTVAAELRDKLAELKGEVRQLLDESIADLEAGKGETGEN